MKFKRFPNLVRCCWFGLNYLFREKISQLAVTTVQYTVLRTLYDSQSKKLNQKERELAITHTGNILGRTFEEILEVYDQFSTAKRPDHFLHLIYWLGKRAMGEIIENSKRVINFSPVLRERLGHHIHGEAWANTIKETLKKNKLLDRPIHIISANVHSVMNTLHAPKALKSLCAKHDIFTVYEILSKEENESLRNKIKQIALQEGMIFIKDSSGTNIDVQIFDASKIDFSKISLIDFPAILL